MNKEDLIKGFKNFIFEEEKTEQASAPKADLAGVINIFKNKLTYYLLLIPVFALALYVRTRNLALLQGNRMIELDSYVFFRYAKEIFTTGSLFGHGLWGGLDPMRYVPNGFTIDPNYSFFPYVMAYCYKLVQHFGLTQMEWHIIYPPVFTIISLIFLFLFVKELFNEKVALISVAFLAVIPGYIFRSGAGFADHEAIAMVFMFAAFWMFALAWKANLKKGILFGAIAGALTAGMALAWGGGYRFLLVAIALFVILAILFSKVQKKQFFSYLAFVIAFFAVDLLTTNILPSFYHLSKVEFIITYFATLAFLIFILLPRFEGFIDKVKFINKIPKPLLALIIAVIILLIPGAIMGASSPQLIWDKIIHPAGSWRVSFTVSENMQPYFIGGNSWWGQFSWTILLGFFGSAFAFYKMFRRSPKLSAGLAVGYLLFLTAFIFGRFSADSKHANITNFFSSTYLYWFLGFILAFLGVYLYLYSKNRNLFEDTFSNAEAGLLLIFIWFLFTAVISRGAIRTLHMLAPPVAVIAGYFIIQGVKDLWQREKLGKVVAVCLIAFAVFAFASNAQAAAYTNSHMASNYGGQWEQTLTWIKEQTPKDSVFIHWWDYGYWTQTVGERGSVVDGGQGAMWDHATGRYFLTSPSDEETLSFLKTHKVTHALISGEELGKFYAFSFIGSDENFDRRSTIGMFALQKTEEIRDGARMIYSGSWQADQDFVMGSVVLPTDNTFLAGFTIDAKANATVGAPIGYLIYNGKPNTYPIKCLVMEGQKMIFDVPAPYIDGCIVLVPFFQQDSSGQKNAGAFFVSSKVKDSFLARFYLYGEKSSYYKEVFSTDTPLAIYAGQPIGPIKIWEIEYPDGVQTDPKYLEKSIYG